MNIQSKVLLALFACCVISTDVHAAPISVDGVIGAEWSGANVESVLYNPAAPIGNFGAPTNQNHEVAYDILTRGDADYLYVGLTTSPSYAGLLNFSNLYFSTTLAGSNIGFEVQNDRAFIPGVFTGGPMNDGYYPYTTGVNDVHDALTAGSAITPSVIEFAVPWEVFTTNSLGLTALTPPSSAVRLNLSQSFGYSVAGGQLFYGDGRLGIVALPVPEPATVALVGLGLIGSVVVRARRRS